MVAYRLASMSGFAASVKSLLEPPEPWNIHTYLNLKMEYAEELACEWSFLWSILAVNWQIEVVLLAEHCLYNNWYSPVLLSCRG